MAILTKSYKNKANKISKPLSHSEYEDKDEFYLKWAKYIYSRYASNSTLIPCDWGSRKPFEELELYSTGTQHPSIYQNRLDPADPNTGGRLWNISWGIEPLIPMQKRKIQGIFDGIKTRFYINSSDGFSIEQKNLVLAETKLRSNAQFKELMAQLPVKPSNQNGFEFPNEQAVDLAVELDGIKLDYEVAFESIIDATIDENNFEPVIKPMLIDDLITFNLAAVEVSPQKTGRIKLRRVNPANFIIDPSEHPDFRDSQFGGELKKMKIFQLREYGLDEKTLTRIAKQNKKMNYNRSATIDWGSYNNHNGVVSEISDFDVWVMTYAFVSSESECYIMGKHPVTGIEIYKKESDYLEEKGDDDDDDMYERDEVSIQNTYRASWVIGTDVVFGCGELDPVVRSGEVGAKHARLPYAVISSKNIGLVEGAVSAVDDFHSALFKWRNAVQSLPPESIGLDLALMSPSVDIGGKNYNILQLVEFWVKTGRFVYKSKNEHGVLMGGSNRPPVSPIADSSGERLNQLAMAMSTAYQRVLDNFGVSQIDKMEDPNERAEIFKGTGNVANNELKDLAIRYKSLVGSLGYLITETAIVMAKEDLLDYQHPNLEDISADSVGLNMEVIDIQKAEQDIAEMVNKRYVEGTIAEDVKMKVISLVRDGKIKKAEFVLAVEVEKAIQQKQMMQERNIQMQGEINQQNAQMAAQAKQQEIQMETQKELAKINAEKDAKIALEELKHTNRMAELKFIESNGMKNFRV
jgi:hypothetical protein